MSDGVGARSHAPIECPKRPAVSYSLPRFTRPAICKRLVKQARSRTPVRNEKSTPASTQEVATSVQFRSSLFLSRSMTRFRVFAR